MMLLRKGPRGDLARVLTDLLVEAGRTQSAVAREAGIDVGYLNKLRTGERKSAPRHTILAIARAVSRRNSRENARRLLQAMGSDLRTDDSSYFAGSLWVIGLGRVAAGIVDTVGDSMASPVLTIVMDSDGYPPSAANVDYHLTLRQDGADADGKISSLLGELRAGMTGERQIAIVIWSPAEQGSLTIASALSSALRSARLLVLGISIGPAANLTPAQLGELFDVSANLLDDADDPAGGNGFGRAVSEITGLLSDHPDVALALEQILPFGNHYEITMVEATGEKRFEDVGIRLGKLLRYKRIMSRVLIRPRLPFSYEASELGVLVTSIGAAIPPDAKLFVGRPVEEHGASNAIALVAHHVFELPRRPGELEGKTVSDVEWGRVLIVSSRPEGAMALSERLGILGVPAITCGSEWKLVVRALTSKVISTILLMVDGTATSEQLFMLLRELTDMPIAILSSDDSTEQLVWYMENGASDFYTVKTSPSAIAYKLKALDRQKEAPSRDVVRSGDLMIDLTSMTVTRDGQRILLTPIEFRLLQALAENAGRVCSHNMLLERVWGDDFRDCTHYLRLYIGYLRQKLERDPGRPRILLTEWGRGYRMVSAPEDRVSEAAAGRKTTAMELGTS